MQHLTRQGRKEHNMPVNPITGEWEFEIETAPQPQQQQAPPPQQRYQPNFGIPDQWAPMGGGGPGAPLPPQMPQAPMGGGGPGGQLPNDAMGNNAAALEAWQKLKADQEAKTQGQKLGGAAGSIGSGLLGLGDMMAQNRAGAGTYGPPAQGWMRTGQPGITDLMKILSGLGRPGR
jgi:hypothetical protein